MQQLYHALREIDRGDLCVRARLASIKEDGEFAQAVVSRFKLPSVANLRCGLWYMPVFDSTCYFKSTDGHTGQWAFSLRRLNIALLHTVARHGGAVVVDSTRRGKSFPDSLSKTIPIWCAVINLALQLHRECREAACAADVEGMLCLPDWLPKSERDQIARGVPAWVAHLLASSVDLTPLSALLQRPLRPVWVCRDEEGLLDDVCTVPENGLPIVCLSVSKTHKSPGYVQGAGDDEEAWSKGLTPHMFWAHCDALMSADDIDTAIGDIVEEGEQGGCGGSGHSEHIPAARLTLMQYDGALLESRVQSDEWDVVVALGLSSLDAHNVLALPLKEASTDKVQLLSILKKTVEFLRTEAYARENGDALKVPPKVLLVAEKEKPNCNPPS